MSPGPLKRQLESVGRTVSWWRAQIKLCAGAAGVILLVWAFALLDLWLRYGRTGRLAVWLAIVAGIAAAAWWTRTALGRSFSPLAVAALLEKHFPQLDNHLINYLQFAANPGRDPFKLAYVRSGPPPLQPLDVRAMRNRRAHRRAWTSLGVALALLVLPGFFVGSAWGVALWRVVNPFSNAQPATLTQIVGVAPGDTTVLQGSPLVLTCTVRGQKGHDVALDIDPADEDKTTYALGDIAGSGNEDFSHRLRKVNTEVRYRFRAGDAAFPRWYTVKTRPPLAFSEVNATVTPPAYTRRTVQRFDALSDDLAVPVGSTLDLRARANLPVETLVLKHGEREQPMIKQNADATVWEAGLVVSNAAPPRLLAEGKDGDALQQDLRFTLEPDRLPRIHILAPEGRPVLAPGAQPSISFEVLDDYGLDAVWVERVTVGGDRSEGDIVERWDAGDSRELARTWTDGESRTRDQGVAAYRIAARDNCPLGAGDRVTRSPPIVFSTPSMTEASKAREKLETEAFATLSRVIELQRENLARSRTYAKVLANATGAQWEETADRQQEIRTLTRDLLRNPLNPLGNLTATAKKLYLNEMADVIPLLAGIPDTAEADRPGRVDRALAMEEKILRQLTFADVAAARSMVEQRVAALAGMLARMIKEEDGIIKQTRTYAEQSAEVSETLVSRQDDLSLDVTAFVQACRTESAQVAAHDDAYAALLLDVADTCDRKKVRGDMLLAAEQLDLNKPDGALPHANTALEKLKLLQAMMDDVAMKEELERQQQLMDAIEEARKRFEKIEDVHRKALESMEMVKDQLDKDDKDVDMLEEEYEELLKKTKEAMLEVPTDLNIFMELNVANDIVEDVFSVFEEIEQAPGSEQMDPGDVNERALAKREGYLDGMEEAKDRLDDLESWLANAPDSTKITAEPFDQEEMPEAGIALGALTTEAEELIGDLLEKQDDMAQEADDGAINTSVPDMVANNEVKEGDVANFSAKGKSGNETPDHKEQDGRSNVGRQGMAVGETAAGSGTVHEGDKNIEERRTQDPTQSGQIDIDGEDIDTKATGGGKLATGKADDVGMDGGTKRMDSMEQGSPEGLAALMAEKADSLYAKASMQNVRADSLKDAAHHLRQSADAIARGNIAQLREHRRLALAKLKKAKAQIDAAATGTFHIEQQTSLLDDVVVGGPELAPPKYRDLVADYYKALNDGL